MTGEASLQRAVRRLESLSRFGIRLGLERMAFMLDRLGHPERRFAVVHVGGTNGKGSVSATLAAAYRAAGLRTALFTSPHLERWTERYALDGAEMDAGEFAALVDECWPLVDVAGAAGLDPPTEFELLTALAYVWARDRRVDVLVQEVGLGGRLDSTNLVERPALVVLTNVSLDHTDRLGTTVEAIAAEKAGIVKGGRPVVSGLAGAAAAVLARRCAGVDAPLYELDSAVHYRGTERWEQSSQASQPLLDYEGLAWKGRNLPLALPGPHQARNMALALLALEAGNAAGAPPVSWDDARHAIASVSWPGRLEAVRLPAGPLAILDGAHNVDAARALAEALPRAFRWRRLHAVLGMLADKDVEGALPLLARHADAVHLAPPPSPRAAAVPRMREALRDLPDLAVTDHPSPEAAWTAASAGFGPEDAILVAGSLYLVGALRPLLLHAGPQQV